MNKEEVIEWVCQIYSQDRKQIIPDWATNRISILLSSYFDEKCPDMYNVLKYNYSKFERENLPYDLYIKSLNCLFVIDEDYKFTTYRLNLLENYNDVCTWFDQEEYINICYEHKMQIDKLPKNRRKRTAFAFDGGAGAKRAMMDVMIDIKPIKYGLNPTLRLHEFELLGITKEQLKTLIDKKLASKPFMSL